jgi:hypothetical protein
MDYLDFELSIDRRGDGAYEISARSPAGEARARSPLRFDHADLDAPLAGFRAAVRGLRDLGSDADGGATVAAPPEAGVRALGTALFRAAMVDGVGECWRVSLAKVREREMGLRVQLRIQAPEVAALPWEFLYDPGQDDFAGLSAETPIVRYVEVARAPEALAIERPLRVLGLVASPRDHAALDKAAERARVERAVADLRTAGEVELAWIEGGTFEALQGALRRGPWHVLHYVGHGGFDAANEEGVLLLEGDDGRARPLPAPALGRALAGHPSLRLAVLNACDGARASADDVFSSTAGVLVRRGIPAVVAMQYPITDRAAVEFAHAFYGALADGAPVDAAVTGARLALGAADRRSVEWGTPVLFLRAPDGVLFRTEHTAEWQAAGPAGPPRAGAPRAGPGRGAGGRAGARPVARPRMPGRVGRAGAAALVAPALAAAGLAAARAPTAEVQLTAVVGEATFRLDSARALRGALPAAGVGASGMHAIDVPGGGAAAGLGAGGTVEGSFAYVTPAAFGDSGGAVRLDLGALTLPAGTRVTAGGTAALGAFRLTLAGTLPPVGVTLARDVRLRVEADTATLHYDVPARLRLLPAARAGDSAVVDLDLEFRRGDTVQLAEGRARRRPRAHPCGAAGRRWRRPLP